MYTLDIKEDAFEEYENNITFKNKLNKILDYCNQQNWKIDESINVSKFESQESDYMHYLVNIPVNIDLQNEMFDLEDKLVDEMLKSNNPRIVISMERKKDNIEIA